MSLRLPTIRLPVEKPRSICNKSADPKPLLQGLTDPFLYNPRKISSDKVSHPDSYKVIILLDFFIPGNDTRGSKRSTGVRGHIAKSLYLRLGTTGTFSQVSFFKLPVVVVHILLQYDWCSI